MRSNRSSYSSTPAGSSRALDQKPRPKRPKKEWNQMLLMLFFVVLPVLGILAIFFQPMRWIFMAVSAVGILLMWLVHAFLFPGRMIVSAAYGLLMIFTLVSALNAQGSMSKAGQQSVFIQQTPIPKQTPVFVYDPYASGSVYSDGLNGLQEVGLSGGSQDQSGLDLGLSDAGATGYVSSDKSAAEDRLSSFMEKWRKGIIADMVAYTPQSWRNAQAESAQQQLFWKFAQRPLVDWRQMSAPTGTDASTARTITVEADVNYGGATRTYQYDAIMLFENDDWFVDPDSLSSGILVTPATPTPDPNMTPAPTPEPTPTPTPGPKTKLYYNKNGGKRYHIESECYTVDKKYLPLASFQYKDLEKSPYNRLEPCEKCGAPL